MPTTIKEFASAFETTSRNVMLLLLSNPEFFKERTNINGDNYDNIELSNKAIDQLEDLITNQKDKLELPIQSICQLLSLSVEEIELHIKTYKAAHKGERINRTVGCIKYTTLISILDEAYKIKHPDMNLQAIFPDNNDTKPVLLPSDTSDITPTTPASKTKRKKKSKYAATKNDILNLVSNEAFITEIRIFLLDSGEYDAKELAVMSDMDILSTYNKTYATLQSKNGTVIIKMDALCNIIDHIYCINSGK